MAALSGIGRDDSEGSGRPRAYFPRQFPEPRNEVGDLVFVLGRETLPHSVWYLP